MTTTKPVTAQDRLTKLEREAVGFVIADCLAGDPDVFFRDACGVDKKKSEKLAEALRRAQLKI